MLTSSNIFLASMTASKTAPFRVPIEDELVQTQTGVTEVVESDEKVSFLGAFRKRGSEVGDTSISLARNELRLETPHTDTKKETITLEEPISYFESKADPFLQTATKFLISNGETANEPSPELGRAHVTKTILENLRNSETVRFLEPRPHKVEIEKEDKDHPLLLREHVASSGRVSANFEQINPRGMVNSEGENKSAVTEVSAHKMGVRFEAENSRGYHEIRQSSNEIKLRFSQTEVTRAASARNASPQKRVDSMMFQTPPHVSRNQVESNTKAAELEKQETVLMVKKPTNGERQKVATQSMLRSHAKPDLSENSGSLVKKVTLDENAPLAKDNGQRSVTKTLVSARFEERGVRDASIALTEWRDVVPRSQEEIRPGIQALRETKGLEFTTTSSDEEQVFLLRQEPRTVTPMLKPIGPDAQKIAGDLQRALATAESVDTEVTMDGDVYKVKVVSRPEGTEIRFFSDRRDIVELLMKHQSILESGLRNHDSGNYNLSFKLSSESSFERHQNHVAKVQDPDREEIAPDHVQQPYATDLSINILV